MDDFIDSRINAGDRDDESIVDEFRTMMGHGSGAMVRSNVLP